MEKAQHWVVVAIDTSLTTKDARIFVFTSRMHAESHVKYFSSDWSIAHIGPLSEVIDASIHGPAARKLHLFLHAEVEE